jgi:hypothetical protein
MNPVVYNGDERYPGPQAHLPPSDILGIPSQAELDAFPRMFTWGELKEIICECTRSFVMMMNRADIAQKTRAISSG